MCSIQIPVTFKNQVYSLFWDINSNLTATVQFIADSILDVVFISQYEKQASQVQLSPTESLVITNNGETVQFSEKLIELLKHKSTSLLVEINNRFSNLQLMVQYRTSRKLLQLSEDMTIEQLKRRCLVGFFLNGDSQELFESKAVKTSLFYNGYEMEDARTLSSYQVEDATFIYMTAEEEAKQLQTQQIRFYYQRSTIRSS